METGKIGYYRGTPCDIISTDNYWQHKDEYDKQDKIWIVRDKSEQFVCPMVRAGKVFAHINLASNNVEDVIPAHDVGEIYPFHDAKYKSDNYWFENEFSKITPQHLVAIEFGYLQVRWPSGDCIQDYIVPAHEYQREGSDTGFEVIDFSHVIADLYAIGLDPHCARVVVRSKHTNLDDLLCNLVEINDVINKKCKELGV